MPFRRLAVPLASLASAAAAYFVMATESSASGDHDKEDESELVIGALLQPVIKKNGRFDNPWPTWRFPSVGGLLKFMFATKDYSAIPKREVISTKLQLALNSPLHVPPLSLSGTRPDSADCSSRPRAFEHACREGQGACDVDRARHSARPDGQWRQCPH